MNPSAEEKLKIDTLEIKSKGVWFV